MQDDYNKKDMDKLTDLVMQTIREWGKIDPDKARESRMNKNKKTYHIKETHNHTGKITLWGKPLYTPLEFAEELISYFAEKDGYIAIDRLLFHEDKIERDAFDNWAYDRNDAIIDLDDPQIYYGDFLWDYTYEMEEDTLPFDRLKFECLNCGEHELWCDKGTRQTYEVVFEDEQSISLELKPNIYNQGDDEEENTCWYCSNCGHIYYEGSEDGLIEKLENEET